MLDPKTIMVAIPCYDGKLMVELVGGLLGVGNLFYGFTGPAECSHPSLVRNIIAGQFLASPFEWLVCIDSDIVPPSRRDFECLLEAVDTETEYCEPDSSALTDAAKPPRPTRVVTAQIVDPPPGVPWDPKLRTAGAADVLVCAEYAYKTEDYKPVSFGMGFVRIHRSVFETLQNLKHEPGQTVEVRRDLVERLKGIHFGDVSPADPVGYPREDVEALLASVEDKAGTARLWQVSHKGRLYTDFYPSGPLISQFVPSGEWKGEDHGFFTLCMLAGIVPRIETRTRLLHIGRKAYPYLGPDQGEGQ